MKRKALCFVLTLLVMVAFSLVGCGGGGGHSNPASSNIAGSARVSGVVYDSSNKPVPNANVKLVQNSKALVNSLTENTNSSARFATNGNQTEFDTLTDNKGQYTFDGVPSGDYTLSAVTANRAQIIKKLTVRANIAVQQDLTIMPTGTITGTVTIKSNAVNNDVSGIFVYVENTSLCSVTDGSGKYTITNVPSSTENYTLNVFAPALKISGEATVEAKAANEKTGDSLKWTKDLELELDSTIATANKLTVNLESALGSDLMLFAVSTGNTSTYAGCIAAGKTTCDIYIQSKGSYKLIPAYVSNTSIISVTSFGTVTGNISCNEETHVITVNGDGSIVFILGTSSLSNYATLNLTVKTSGNFTASLFDSTGHENKISISGTGLFKNLVPGKYALAVYSDTMLKVKTGITLNEGENSEEITPVNIIPEFTSGGGSGCATATLDFSSASPITSNSDGLYFSLLSKGDFDTKELYDINWATTTIKVKSEKMVQAFSLDTLSSNDNYKSQDQKPSDSINAIKFFFTNGLNKNVFEKSFPLGNKSISMDTTSYKAITFKDNSGSPIPQSNVIYFNTIVQGEKTGYLVVTSDSAYVYEGTSETPYSTFNFSTYYSGVKIKQGNVSYIDSEKLMVVQFLKQDSVTGNDTGTIIVDNLYIVGCKFDLESNTPVPTLIYIGNDYNPPGNNLNPNYQTDIISPNKVLIEGNDLISLSDDCIRYFKLEDNLSQLTSPTNISYFGGNLIVIATSSTIIKDYNSIKLYYLGNDSSDVVCLAEGQLDSANNYKVINENVVARLGEYKDLSEALEDSINLRKPQNQSDCSTYYLFDISSYNDYPYSMTDCLDNTNAETKILLNDAQNVKDTKFILSNTLYSGTNIKSSYKYANLYETWIERNSDGQHLILLNTNTYKEQRIKINQVLNASGYLEGSIGFTSINNDEKLHVLCADEDGNINVIVLNLAKGIN